jgi:hypothetical protein
MKEEEKPFESCVMRKKTKRERKIGGRGIYTPVHVQSRKKYAKCHVLLNAREKKKRDELVFS